MGCSICMEDFDEAEDGQRPAALPCGHIFHYSCAQTWFFGNTAATNPTLAHNKRCPLCAKPTNPNDMMRLYPSEGNDLDRYLQARHWTQDEDAIFALTAPTLSSTEAVPHRSTHDLGSRDMLASLLGLNQALQSFVMAAHNIRVEPMCKAGAKVIKLVRHLRPVEEHEDHTELQRALDSLIDVASMYERMKKSLDKANLKLREDKAKIRAHNALVERNLAGAKQIEARAQSLSDQAAAKMREAEKAQQDCKTLRQDLDRRKTQLDKAEADLNKRRRDVEHDRQQDELRVSMRISSIETKTNEQLREMKNEVKIAQDKRREAEQQRETTKDKNNFLAEQMRGMKDKMTKQLKLAEAAAASSKGARLSATPATPTSPASTVGSAATIRKQAAEIMALEKTVKRLKSEQAPNGRKGFVDLTRSSSPSQEDSERWSDIRRQKRSRRSSLFVEPENLDDELDDDLYPMPGLAPGMRTNRSPLLRTNTNSSIATNSSRSLIDKMSSSSGVILGPKRKPPL